jgi:hypothetical protein
MKRPARVPSQLPESLHQRLNAYALAASAAGVGMLASVQPAEARIVYTPAHIDCSRDCQLNFIYHKEGSPNSFFLAGTSSGTPSRAGNLTFFVDDYGNSVVGRKRFNDRYFFASALHAGVRVRNSNREQGNHVMWHVGFGIGGGITSVNGPWANGGKGVKNRYLGLKFHLNGEVHYGWARLSVKSLAGNPPLGATLTGYAYETIPNKAIITGKTHEATLGHLATGASAIPTWRVKGTAATSH